tara:strand:+ start:131 stop:403 length:273 start_codon:yes stop_codon:yes gene_type:complete
LRRLGLIFRAAPEPFVILFQFLEIQKMIVSFKAVIYQRPDVPVVPVQSICVGFRVWGDNQHIVFLLFDGATLAIEFLQDLIGFLAILHNQ